MRGSHQSGCYSSLTGVFLFRKTCTEKGGLMDKVGSSGHQQLTRCQEESRLESQPQVSKKDGPNATLIRDFWPPEL